MTFIAMAEAHVLEALSTAGIRPARIRQALNRLANEFGRGYVLASRNLAKTVSTSCGTSPAPARVRA